jgi:hypothetical protein
MDFNSCHEQRNLDDNTGGRRGGIWVRCEGAVVEGRTRQISALGLEARRRGDHLYVDATLKFICIVFVHDTIVYD